MLRIEMHVIQTATKTSDWKDLHCAAKESAQDFLSATQKMCDEINSKYDEGMKCRMMKRTNEVLP